MKPDIPEHTGGMDLDKKEILLASLQILLDTLPDMVFVKDVNLVYVAGTQNFAEMVGKSSMAEILGRTDAELFEDKELARHFTADDKRLFASKQNIIDFIEPITGEDGKPRYALTSKYLLTDREGNTIGLLGTSKNITREIKAKQQHLQEIEYFFSLPDDTHTAVLIDVTDWKIIEQKLHPDKNYIPLFDSLEHLIETATTDIAEESEGHNFYQQFSREFLEGIYEKGRTTLEFECKCKLPNGSKIWLLNSLTMQRDPEDEHLKLIIQVRDIEEKKQKEEKLIEAATIDPLTKLLNRGSARELIVDFLANAGAKGTHAAFMIDLDNFKTVNDTYGHQEGDNLLIRLAQGIKSCFRETDIVCRVGGDEFFVLAKNIPNRKAIKARADQLLRVAKEAHTADTASVSSVSIGISIYPDDGDTLGELYVKADEALYKSKRLGKNRASFVSGE